MVVYLDVLFALEWLIDDLLLALTGRITGAPLRRWRIALSAVLGAFYSVLVTAFPRQRWLSHPLLLLAIGALLVLVAYPSHPHLLRAVAIFYALSGALGGALYALTLHSSAPIPLDLKCILLFAALSYCILSLAGRRLARHAPHELRQVSIRLDDRTTHLTALIDSGNTLTDPMTGKGVLVVEGASLASLLPPEADYCQPAQSLPRLPDPTRFRLLPYRAVGTPNGLLLAVRADDVRLSGRDLGPRLVALSPTPVSDSGNYQALMNLE